MFEYTKRKAGQVFDHPILGMLFILAGLFLVAGFVLDTTTDNAIAVSFMGVYAAFAAGLGVLGYLTLFFFKVISLIQDRTAAYA